MPNLTLSEFHVYLPHLKRITSSGKPMLIGSCPMCGGRDRFFANENADGKVLWGCRKGAHIPDRPDFFFGDRLLDTLGYKPIDFEPDPNFVRQNDRQERPPKEESPKWSENVENPVQLSLEDAIRYNANSTPAMKYFGQFGLNLNTLNKFKIGYAVNPPHCALPAGYSIPNLSYGPDGKVVLKGLQIRRDEEVCMSVLKSRGAYWMEEQRNLLCLEWTELFNKKKRKEVHDPTDAELLNWLYPKYTSITGTKPGIWGDDLVSLPGGERIGPHLSYIFMVEDAKSAMALRQDGYPAVAYRRRKNWTDHLDEIFQRCAAVYIIADRDEKENNEGQGMKYAREFEASIRSGGKSFTRIFMPPEGVNDVADLVRADGFDAMRSWLGNKLPGLLPEWESENE